MNSNVNKRRKSTGDSIRLKLLRSINVNVQANVDHFNADKEESGVDSEVHQKIFQEYSRTGNYSDQNEDEDDVETVDSILSEPHVLYIDHGAIGYLLKNKEKEESHADALYKHTKSRSRRRLSVKKKVLSRSNKNSAQIGGDFSSKHDSGLEDIEEEMVF